MVRWIARLESRLQEVTEVGLRIGIGFPEFRQLPVGRSNEYHPRA